MKLATSLASITANDQPPGETAARLRRRDLLEIAAAYTLILIVIWTPRPWQRLIYFVAAGFILITSWISFRGWRTMGFRATNSARSMWLVGVALLIAGAEVYIASRMAALHAPDNLRAFFHRYWGYILFACIQQLLMQDFFLPRLLRLFGEPLRATFAAAAIFALAHLPNPILTVATLFWGLAACRFFLRYHNLYPLFLAHSILGIALAISVPGPVIHNMRVGLGYLTYQAHPVITATTETKLYRRTRE